MSAKDDIDMEFELDDFFFLEEFDLLEFLSFPESITENEISDDLGREHRSLMIDNGNEITDDEVDEW